MEDKANICQFYYPCCRESGCKGILKIKINEDFSIDYECDKNKNHKKRRIFFKTFERFYLKKKVICKCSKCYTILEDKNIYKCKQCKEIYCSSCFIFHEHFKIDFNNLSIINNKCPLHKNELTKYCVECDKNLCIYCIKDEENNIHKHHEIICLFDLIPCLNDINNFKKIINER